MIDFSGYTREAIQKEMLDQVDPNIDTREGSMIQTAIGPAAWYLEGVYMILKQIQEIYRKEGQLKGRPSEERLARRQATIKQLVDALFAYLKQHENEVGADKCLCRIWWTNRDIFGGQYEAHEPAK